MILVPFLLFFSVFAIYFLGISPGVFAGDSGDIILASWFGGVAHPPGYPLNTMIGWIFTHLPYSATVAYKANLMATFFQAGTILFVFLAIKKLINNLLVVLAATFVLAFSTLFWTYAHIIEVFQLNNLLIAISLYGLFSYWFSLKKGKEVKKRYLYLAVLFLGLAIFHHHTSVLLLPAYIVFLYLINSRIFRFRRTQIILGLFLVIGSLPYIFVPFAALRETPVNWDDARNLENFVRLITRADYGTFSSSPGVIGIDLKARTGDVIFYILLLKTDFKIIGILFALVGAIYTFLKNKPVFWFLTLSLFMIGPFFFFYSAFPYQNDFFVGLLERFLLLSYIFLTFFVAFGMNLLITIVREVLSGYDLKVFKGRLLSVILTLPFFALSLFFILDNIDKTDLSNYYLGDYLGLDVLASAENGSIIFLSQDTATFNTDYIYYTAKITHNLVIIKSGLLGLPEYRRQIIKEYPNLNYDQFFLDDERTNRERYLKSLINKNKDEYEIYSVDALPDMEGYKNTNSGLLTKLVSETDYDISNVVNTNQQKFSAYSFNNYDVKSEYRHYLSSHTVEIYYLALIRISDELIAQEAFDEAKEFSNLAVEIFDNKKEAYVRLGRIYLEKGNCIESENALLRAYRLDSDDPVILFGLSVLYEDCFNNNVKAQYYRDLQQKFLQKGTDNLSEF